MGRGSYLGGSTIIHCDPVGKKEINKPKNKKKNQEKQKKHGC